MKIPQGARVIASISGGKDSAAMALHLREQGIPFESVFCDTGWEHPDTYTYLREVLDPAIGPIRWLKSDRGGMEELVRSKAMFPSRVRRFCTEELKVVPLRQFFLEVCAAIPDDDPPAEVRALRSELGDEFDVTAQQIKVINVVGIRAEESPSRAEMSEWEVWGADYGKSRLPVMVWRPLLRWTGQDVIDIHKRHGLAPNPLYLRGASRVGCWPCIHARKAELALVAKESPERIALIRSMESDLTDAARARSAARALKPWPDGLDEEMTAIEQELRDPTHERHERGFFQGPTRNGITKIDEMVEWAKTDRGGRQYMLFEQDGARDGCMRWGMCETGGEP